VELHNLYPLPIIITAIKSRRRWARHAVRMGVMRNAYQILVGEPEGNNSGNLGLVAELY